MIETKVQRRRAQAAEQLLKDEQERNRLRKRRMLAILRTAESALDAVALDDIPGLALNVDEALEDVLSDILSAAHVTWSKELSAAVTVGCKAKGDESDDSESIAVSEESGD